MSFSDEIIGACIEAEEMVENQTITLPSGAVLPCVPSMMTTGATTAIGPDLEDLKAIVTVRKSHFITVDLTNITADNSTITVDNNTPRLRSGKTATVNTIKYRVLNYQEDPSGAYFKIFLGSAK